MVENIHERMIDAPLAKVGGLIDQLASRDDLLWPRDRWPAMRFDRPLEVGAVGGHGPVRYFVEAYEPGRFITFRFTAPKGFVGTHALEVEAGEAGATRLRHVLRMRARGLARLSWPLVFRWLHDALVEDALDRAEGCGISQSVKLRQWSHYVRLLRYVVARSNKNRARRLRNQSRG
jgi:hypothetical protein